MIHELKTWPEPFEAVVSGKKTHELRVNDRPFAVGDVLMLCEYDPLKREYTAMTCNVQITYITHGGAFGLPDNMCVMSIQGVSNAK